MSKNDQPLDIKLNDTDVNKLWANYGERLRTIASRFLGAGRRIEDSHGIANAAFLSLVKKIGSDDFNEGEADRFWPLAIGIARNKAREANRRALALQRGGGAVTSPIEGVTDARAEDPSVLAQLEELIERLDKYTEERPKLRTTIEKLMEGKTQKEAAIELGMTPVKVHRILAELKAFLSEN